MGEVERSRRPEPRATHGAVAEQKVGPIFGLALLCVATLGCDRGATPTGLAQEIVPPTEAADIQNVIGMFKTAVAVRDGDGLTRRGAHPKHHGCVRARFKIAAALAPELRIGLFQPGRDYPAWIRFSNNADPQPDREPDVRGIAIKLLEVPGEKLLDVSAGGMTHDLLLVTHPVFPFADVATYTKAFALFAEGKVLSFFFNPLDLHVRSFLVVREMLAEHHDLLAARWFSMVPYLYGEGRAVKYAARPCSEASVASPGAGEDDFLGARLASRLADGDACFEFMLQFQRDPESTPIEDATVLWDEGRSPFVPVGRLEIPAQSFTADARQNFCENLSFNPWRALPEHRPLGGISRARRAIYAAVSNYRFSRNKIDAAEPASLHLE